MGLPQVASKVEGIKKMFQAPEVVLAVKEALPNVGIDSDYLARVFITQISETPKLLECTPVSLTRALIRSAELGIQPGSALGQCYLIPYGREAKLMIGYRGMLEIVRRSGEVRSCKADVVYEKDVFEYYMDETGEKITHKKSLLSAKDRGKMVGAYFTVWFLNGGVSITYMTFEEIAEIRKKHSKGGNIWKDHPEEMAKKTVIRRAFKMLPASIVPPQAAQQVEDEYKTEASGPVIETEFTEEPTDALEAGSKSPRKPKQIEKKAEEKPVDEPRAKPTPDIPVEAKNPLLD
jgi:recombination protein RecT